MPLAPRLRRGKLARLSVPLLALWKLLWHRDTPWYARLMALVTIGYVLSPVDLVPDVLPVVGWLDDLLVIPLGIALSARLTTRSQWRARLAEAEVTLRRMRPRVMWTVAALLALWVALVVAFGWWLFHS